MKQTAFPKWIFTSNIRQSRSKLNGCSRPPPPKIQKPNHNPAPPPPPPQKKKTSKESATFQAVIIVQSLFDLKT